MPGNGGAADPGQGAAKDEFEGFTFDFWMLEIVPKVVKDSVRDLWGKGPGEVACLAGGFFDREDKPVFAEACWGAPRDDHEGKRSGDGFFSGHRDF